MVLGPERKFILVGIFLGLSIFTKFALARCVTPYENMYINEDTIFCSGIYYLNDTDTNGVIIINTSSESKTVLTPTVNAVFGTLSTSLSKNLELAIIVSWVKVFTLVVDESEEPGSLNAICPSGPIPPINR